jgi:hypothetical protein
MKPPIRPGIAIFVPGPLPLPPGEGGVKGPITLPPHLATIMGKRMPIDVARLMTVSTTIEAEVDENGNIRPKKPLVLAPGSRILVTVLTAGDDETALLSEVALASDWQRPEEDAAWSHLGPAESF